MASNRAHHIIGWAAGVVSITIVHKALEDPWKIWGLLSFAAGILGGTAPDWLEVAWWSLNKRKLWIKHRTFTHWGMGWVILAIYSYGNMNEYPIASIGLGFACGGIMHLLADWPNPLGVPWLLRRHSLNLWKSGKCDIVVVALSWIIAFFTFDHIWLNDMHTVFFLNILHTRKS